MFKLLSDEKYPVNKWLLLSQMTVFVDNLFDFLYNVAEGRSRAACEPLRQEE